MKLNVGFRPEPWLRARPGLQHSGELSLAQAGQVSRALKSIYQA